MFSPHKAPQSPCDLHQFIGVLSEGQSTLHARPLMPHPLKHFDYYGVSYHYRFFWTRILWASHFTLLTRYGDIIQGRNEARVDRWQGLRSAGTRAHSKYFISRIATAVKEFSTLHISASLRVLVNFMSPGDRRRGSTTQIFTRKNLHVVGVSILISFLSHFKYHCNSEL